MASGNCFLKLLIGSLETIEPLIFWYVVVEQHIVQLWKVSQQTFVLMKKSWRRLEEVFCLRLQKTSSRRLDQDQYVCLSLTFSEDVFKMSWSRPIYSSWSYVFKTSYKNIFKTSSRRLQNVLKTSSRRLAKMSSRRFEKGLQDIFKTSCQKVFKTFWKRSSRHLQDVLQRYHQVSTRIIKLICSC